MSDSSIVDDLFGNTDQQQQEKVIYEDPPSYYNTQEFKSFVKLNEIDVDPVYGYIFIELQKPFYFPGQTVRGHAIMDVFNPLKRKNFIVRVKGKERPGRYTAKISKRIMNTPNTYRHSAKQQWNEHSQFQKKSSMKVGSTLEPVYLHQNFENTATKAILQSSSNQNQDSLVDSVNAIQTRNLGSKKEVKNEKGIYIIEKELIGFTFKDKHTPKGQYRFPFAFKLPYRIPGSFKYKNKTGEQVDIVYTVECYFEHLKTKMCFKKEIPIREFLFTEEEINEDWKKYERIVNLKKVLKTSAVKVKLDDESPTMKMKKLIETMKEQTSGLTNKEWNFVSQHLGRNCLCFTSNYLIKAHVSLNKQMFYPDEQVIIKILIDNSRSTRDIVRIDCTLNYDIKIKKNLNDTLHNYSTDLQLQQLKGVEKNKVKEREEFIFNLKDIFDNFSKIKNLTDSSTKALAIQKMSSIQEKSQKRRGSHVFEKQLSRFVETTQEYTFLTVNGITIQCQFSLQVAITIQDILGEHVEQQHFPIIIRSNKNGEFIHDFDTQGLLTQTVNHYSFLEPFSLPGCNFVVNLK